MKLYWGRDDEMELLGEVATKEELWKCINNFLDEIGFESHYCRLWYHPDDTLVIDYGSWRNFFYVKEHGYGNDLCAWH